MVKGHLNYRDRNKSVSFPNVTSTSIRGADELIINPWYVYDLQKRQLG